MNNLPPQNIEFEQQILSSCFIDSDSLDVVLDILTPEDFYKTAHQLIYSAMLELKTKSEPVDLVTVAEKLTSLKTLCQVGGATYLAQITDIPIARKPEYTAHKIKEYAALRETINICHNTIKSCFEANGDTEEVIDDFQKKILQIDVNIAPEDYTDIKQLAIDGEERHETISKNRATVSGITTGFKDLDSVTCGFQKGDLIIIAARPSMGKSSLMRNISVNSAKKDFTNAIISLEMSKEQLYDSMSASESGVNLMKFRNGYFLKEDWELKIDAAGRLYKLPITIVDNNCFKLLDICRIARRLKKKKDIKAIFIDYLQLISGTVSQSKNYEIGDITRRLKQLAKELDIAVVLLSQLNRSCESRPDKRPLMADLRDSGSIEQDADMVMFLYRQEQYIKKKYEEDGSETEDMKKWSGKAELNIAKQRMGPTRRVFLTWIGKSACFKNQVQYST